MKRNIDLDWYENRAKSLLKSPKKIDNGTILENISSKHLRPFLFFYELITTNIQEGWKVLEIGSGTGDHTEVILNTKANLTAFDISPSSLEVLRHRHPTVARTVIGNMEDMPFHESEFDAVVSCGSLSYGNPKLSLSEIYRVLKPGGVLIILDTLANNPFFTLSRIRHVLLQRRSLYTLIYMPSTKTIKQIVDFSHLSKVSYFDPLIAFIPRNTPDCKLFRMLAQIVFQVNIRIERSAFKFFSHKFVLFAQKHFEITGNIKKDFSL
jgi:ubiquinone/menaquinone biosynthesis C-methylase UbiE